MLPPVRSKLKTGKRPKNVLTKTLNENEVLFEEGSKGKEVYIIKEGKVGVYKSTPEGEIELAIIEKGGIIGEMSLLDNQPRSATIRAIESTESIIINENVFQATISTAPIWLTSIVKIIVSRLRDANIRVDYSALRNREKGIVSLILLLLPDIKYNYSSKITMKYDTVIIEAYYVCRLRKKEIIKILQSIQKRGIIELKKGDAGNNHICINDLEVLKLYFEYLTLKDQHKKFQEISIPKEAINLLSNIAYVAQKAGVERREGTTLLKSILFKDMADKDFEKLEKSLLDLRRKNLINIMPEGNDSTIIFKQQTLSRIKKIITWVPRFEMEIK